MDYMPLFIVIGGFIAMLVYFLVMNIKCRREFKRLAILGELKGKTIDDIVAEIGEPDSRLPIANGDFCQWVQFGYHLSLTFDKDGVCTAVDSLKKN